MLRQKRFFNKFIKPWDTKTVTVQIIECYNTLVVRDKDASKLKKKNYLVWNYICIYVNTFYPKCIKFSFWLLLIQESLVFMCGYKFNQFKCILEFFKINSFQC